MQRSSVILLLATLILSTGTGCSLNPGRSGESPGVSPWIQCREPRPEVCTFEYDPVCGRLGNGGFKTYGNACTACADTEAVEYRPGTCD